MTEQTLRWFTERVEKIIPDQLENAIKTLGRVSMAFYGQEQLFNPEQEANITYYRSGEE